MCPDIGCSYWSRIHCKGHGFTVALALSLVFPIMKMWRFGHSLMEML